MADASSGLAKDGSAPGARSVTIEVPSNAIEAIRKAPGLFVKQRVDLMEVVTACEKANKYDVYNWAPPAGGFDATLAEIRAAADDTPFMRFEEDPSGCCHRQLCGADRRFTVKTTLLLPSGVSRTAEASVPLELKKEFVCCTCVKPPAFLWWGDKVVAQIRNTVCCSCDWVFEIGPPSDYPDRAAIHPDMATAPDAPWYTVRQGCCEICCKECTCAKNIELPICDAASGEQVAGLHKVFKGCCAEAVTKADDFALTFPVDALPLQKAALALFVVYVDFAIFEQDDGNNGGGGG